MASSLCITHLRDAREEYTAITSNERGSVVTDARNLLFFLTDNHNRNALGCYGHPMVQTPTLDSLAERGVRFANAYTASPICCPARAALATGRFPHQTGYWDNCIVYGGRVQSWMHRVREQGHTVTGIGKLLYRSSDNDNGFTEELIPMHILGGKGGLPGLLRSIGKERPHESDWGLYADYSRVGEAPYQVYDRDITRHAIEWLKEHAHKHELPWVLKVSYPSPHPPFMVPQELLDLYPVDSVPLPPCFRAGERPEHEAIQHLRHHTEVRELSEPLVRQITAAYLALITHVDRQIGEVLKVAEGLGLLETTRILYSSDHGEMHGSHGLLGKYNMYEDSAAVPLILAGHGVPHGQTVQQLVSHVDLFPTIVEAVGAQTESSDDDLHGVSLWSAVSGTETERTCFAEYHAEGSQSAFFMVREGSMKLVHYVDHPPQLFNLAADREERHDLSRASDAQPILARLTKRLYEMCDPVAVERQAKHDQRVFLELWGGEEKVSREVDIAFSPPPGQALDDLTNAV